MYAHYTFQYPQHKPEHKGFYKVYAYASGETIASYWNGKNFVGRFGPWGDSWFNAKVQEDALRGVFDSIKIYPVHAWTGIVRSK